MSGCTDDISETDPDSTEHRLVRRQPVDQVELIGKKYGAWSRQFSVSHPFMAATADRIAENYDTKAQW